MNQPKRRGDQELTEDELMEDQGAGGMQKSRKQGASASTGSENY